MAFAFATLLLIAPLYVWRFYIGEVSTNFLMISSLVILSVLMIILWRDLQWSIRGLIKSTWGNLYSLGCPMLIGIVLIYLSSIISLFAFGFSADKFAQWLVLYQIPISAFLLIRHFLKKDFGSNKILIYLQGTAYLLLLISGALAVTQYFSLETLPQDWWGNANEPKRAIAFFAHPNAYALFATPLLAWLIPDVVKRIADKKYFLPLAWSIGTLGMILSLSRGAWLGLIAAAGIYVLFSASKKMYVMFAAMLVTMIIIVASVPNLRYRVILPFQGEKSAVARLSLWDTGTKMILSEPPQSLIFGKGVTGFSSNWEKFNTDPNLNHYNFPHNIFLNLWIDLGLLGLLGFLLIMMQVIWQGIVNRKNPVAVGLALFVIAIIIHGLIDIPYLKNDLALMFWLILGASYLGAKNYNTA